MRPLLERKAAFHRQVDNWAGKLHVKPRGVYVQPMARKWASCSPAGRLSFSLDLLRQPARFQELVIVHELLHLRIRNHGRLFTALLGAHLPDWRRRLPRAAGAEPCGRRIP